MGAILLGYELTDLNEMIDAIGYGVHYIPPGQVQIAANLLKARTFLEGLWAEGYFS